MQCDPTCIKFELTKKKHNSWIAIWIKKIIKSDACFIYLLCKADVFLNINKSYLFQLHNFLNNAQQQKNHGVCISCNLHPTCFLLVLSDPF